ncbi:hypothetical protein SLA2020_447440 [Shorea laevis]
MASENEPAKLLLPYLQRADELQKHEPLVAYYCRLYAMERGLRIPQSERTKTTNSLLVSLMNQLEKDKKSLKLDKQDRAGRSDLNTAKTFYAASIFFEIVNQFGVLQPDLEEKQKYAAWKAADIRKALKEGRTPKPGPPAGDDDLSIPSSTAPGAYELGPRETAATSPGPESDLSPQFHDKVNNQHSTHIPPSPQFHDKDNQHSAYVPPSPPSYPTSGYPSHDFQPPPPPATNTSESPTYSQPYNHQSYPQEPQQPTTNNLNNICLLITLPLKLPLLTLILIFKRIPVLQRAASQQFHLTILLTIRALMRPTLTNQLLQRQTIHQLPHTVQPAQMGVLQNHPLLLLLKHINMTKSLELLTNPSAGQ